MEKSGGETGIRTLGTREGTTVFETAPFDHSGTSPRGRFNMVMAGRVQEGNWPASKKSARSMDRDRAN